MFSNSLSNGSIENWNKGAGVLVSAVFGTREHLDSERVF